MGRGASQARCWLRAASRCSASHRIARRALLARDRPGRRAPADRRHRRRRRPRARRGRALRPLQGEGQPLGARAPRRLAGREARQRHGDHADEGRRGQDDDVGVAHAGSRPHRAQPRALPARGVARPGLRDQGRRGGRRLRAGRADGGPEPPLHRRHPCDRRREQPARRDARGAHPARQRARHRPALDLVAALPRHQRPRAARHRGRPRRPRERLRPPDRLRHHRRLRGDGDRRRRARPPRTCARGSARSPSVRPTTASRSPRSS